MIDHSHSHIPFKCLLYVIRLYEDVFDISSSFWMTFVNVSIFTDERALILLFSIFDRWECVEMNWKQLEDTEYE